jgi:hypothetical protein
MMELEFMASSNSSSADEVDNQDHATEDNDPVQAELEARIYVSLQTPVLHRSRTPRSARSIRRSGRLVAKPRAANSTKQAQSVLLKKLGCTLMMLLSTLTSNASLGRPSMVTCPSVSNELCIFWPCLVGAGFGICTVPKYCSIAFVFGNNCPTVH